MLTLPPLPWPGGCQCGAFRYEVRDPALTFYACHCRDCQKQSGSAFGLSIILPWSGLAFRGEARELRIRGGSGAWSTRYFCGACGGRIAHRMDGRDTCSLKAGTLDDPTWLRPAGHIWTSRRQGWVTLPEDVAAWEEQPDMDRLRAIWAAMTGG